MRSVGGEGDAPEEGHAGQVSELFVRAPSQLLLFLLLFVFIVISAGALRRCLTAGAEDAILPVYSSLEAPVVEGPPDADGGVVPRAC